MHELTGLLSIITTQAPQSPELQPSLVPVSPRLSRSKYRSVLPGSAFTCAVLPLIVNSMSILFTGGSPLQLIPGSE